MRSEPATRDARDVPAAWFVVLERARETGDRDREREAIRNLSRLGVTVTFAPASPEVAHT
jgi:hypothetical protein